MTKQRKKSKQTLELERLDREINESLERNRRNSKTSGDKEADKLEKAISGRKIRFS